ncbi:MAG: ABC transporter ATP-binding protein [Dehalococcoidia bacterium]|nr:ABC transporter ATP-binding protein [Dehalococcoidia bacterium]
MIRLENLSRFYRAGASVVRALDGVSLAIERGEFVAIMGASGSGKSTMMNIIGLLDRPTSGHYLLEGHDVGRLGDDALARLRSREFGFVFQQFNLLPRMSAVEQVELPLVYQHARQRRRQARAALARVGLAERARHRPTELSGGQQQRVAIARALVVNPRVVLADEPTGALDTATGEEVMQVFGDLVRHQGITVILVTHEADVASHADRLVRMRDGRVVEDTRRRVLLG